MIKILLLAIFMFNLSAQEPKLTFNKDQIEYVKKHNPDLLKEYTSIMESVENREKKFAFYMLVWQLKSSTTQLLNNHTLGML